jgi:MFS transporter, DHA1 family, multidrug resistance protein
VSAIPKAARYITLHYFFTNTGLFGLLSTLAVWLTANHFSGAQTGLLILIFTIANKTAKVPLARWLDRIAPSSSVLLGCLTAACGFVCLQLAHGTVLTGCALALAGLGVSVNALASKQLAAEASDAMDSRARLFSLINIAVNVASAVAAPVALFAASRHHHGWVLAGVAVVYCVAGTATSLNYSRMRPGPRPRAAASSLRAYLTILRLPGMGSFMVVNLLGWLCYGQLFNALAVHVSSTLHAGGSLGFLYTLNALLIVVAQLGVTRLAESWGRGRHDLVAVAAYATFALAFAVIFLAPGYPGAVAGVVVFTVAEMLFVPTMDVLLLKILGQESRAIGYGVFSLGNAVGEGIGGGLGVAVYRWTASGGGHPGAFWLGAAVLGLLSAALAFRFRSTRTHSTGQVLAQRTG